MNESKISVRYAKALFLLAQEKKVQNNIKNDMQLFLNIAQENDDFRFLINTPVLRPSKKAAVLHTVFDKSIHEITKNIIDLLIKNKRETYILGISRHFLQLYYQEKGIKKATITSVTELTKTTETAINTMIKSIFKTDVELHTKIDKTILGGFILQVGDQQINASLKDKLKTVKQELLTTSLQ